MLTLISLADMVPPTLAYYGAVKGDSAMIKSAVDQCRLYRNYLRDPDTKLWKHIVQGHWDDVGLWGTGELSVKNQTRRSRKLTPSR